MGIILPRSCNHRYPKRSPIPLCLAPKAPLIYCPNALAHTSHLNPSSSHRLLQMQLFHHISPETFFLTFTQAGGLVRRRLHPRRMHYYAMGSQRRFSPSYLPQPVAVTGVEQEGLLTCLCLPRGCSAARAGPYQPSFFAAAFFFLGI